MGWPRAAGRVLSTVIEARGGCITADFFANRVRSGARMAIALIGGGARRPKSPVARTPGDAMIRSRIAPSVWLLALAVGLLAAPAPAAAQADGGAGKYALLVGVRQ